MKEVRLARAKTFVISICIALSSCAFRNSSAYPTKLAVPVPTRPESSKSIEWTPSDVYGIRPGKTSAAEVKRILGEPVQQMPPEEKHFQSDDENEMELYYRDVHGVPAVTITVGDHSGLAKSISVDFPGPLSLDEVIRKFGSDFYAINSWETVCVDPKRNTGLPSKGLEVPYFLVYPNAGTIVFVGADNKATYYSVLYKCDTD